MATNSNGQQYITYRIKQGDSLEGIAAAKLGYSGRWREIAALNVLRYPFISENPADWQGPLLSQGYLPGATLAGADRVRLAAERAEIMERGVVVYLEGFRANTSGNHRPAYDAVPVASYDQHTCEVALDGALTTLDWPSGTRYRVYAPLRTGEARVARIGDSLFLPASPGEQSSLIEIESPDDIYGTDIYLGTDGKLSLSDGDLLTVSGYANVGQALRIRTTLPLGEYLIHPDEGNACFGLLGRTASPELLIRAESAVRAAIETDPRVRQTAEVVAVSVAPDAIAVNAVAVLESTEEQIEINTVVRDRL